jgi:hypothetical protein
LNRRRKLLIIGSAVAAVAATAFVASASGAVTPHLVGGHPATQTYPWIASMQISYQGDPNFHNCTASLIAPQWIRVNAHCVTSHRRVIDQMMAAFADARVGQWAAWDATGRINVLHRATDATLDVLVRNGLREVALGIESGSERMLTQIDKHISPEMTRSVVRRLTERGINVKGYFILGFPTETRDEIDATVALAHDLWDATDALPGRFPGLSVRVPTLPGHPGLAPAETRRPNCSTTPPSTSPPPGWTSRCANATSSTSRSTCRWLTRRSTTSAPNSSAWRTPSTTARPPRDRAPAARGARGSGCA